MKNRSCAVMFVLCFWFDSAQAVEINLDWLAGAWCRSSGEVSSEEHWMRSAGGIMLGMSRTITKRGMEYEFVRIELTPTSARYVAMPSNQSETSFELTEAGAWSATFANPSHDFPKRIRYWREGAHLFARIDAGTDSSKSRDFEWTRCEAD
jgi:hypothetical protein